MEYPNKPDELPTLPWFQGPDLLAEAENQGLALEAESYDISRGHDLMDQTLVAQTKQKAIGAEYHGAHAGFPCVTFMRLRWRLACHQGARICVCLLGLAAGGEAINVLPRPDRSWHPRCWQNPPETGRPRTTSARRSRPSWTSTVRTRITSPSTKALRTWRSKMQRLREGLCQEDQRRTGGEVFREACHLSPRPHREGEGGLDEEAQGHRGRAALGGKPTSKMP